MNTDKKHIIVGLFVLGGLILFSLLIIWFQGIAVFLRGGYIVRAHVATASGIRAGKRVAMDGIDVGEVRSVASSLPDRPGVWLGMKIDPDTRIPKEAELVAQESTMGDVSLGFRTRTKPTGYLPTDGSASVEGVLRPPSLLPEEVVKDLTGGLKGLGQVSGQMEGLKEVIANLKKLTEPRTIEEVKAGKPANLSSSIAQFQDTAKGLQDLVEDPKVKKLFENASVAAETLSKTLDEARKAIAAVKTTAETYTETGKNADAMIVKGSDMIDRFSKDAADAQTMIANLNGLATDLRSGKGTLGKLVSTDELHRDLVNLIENLTTMTDNANRLIVLWRHEGITAKEPK